MKKTVFAIFISFSLLFFNSDLKATYYMGGEITWECLPNGQYQFHLKYYRECGGATHPLSYTLYSTSPAGYINMSLVSGWPKDITPQGDSIGGCQLITCAWAEQGSYSNAGAVSEYHYISAPITLNGVPPVSGWEFYSNSCCRNPSSNLIGQTGWRIRAKMYPFNGQNTYPCYDNTPKFLLPAKPAFTLGYTVNYNNYVFDNDMDSLVFSWGTLLDMNGNDITAYANGYSYNSPLPGVTHNSNNIAATINSETGDITFKSYTSGTFVTSVKVSSYKCGVLVSENWREIQTKLSTNGGTNTPPEIDTSLFNDFIVSKEVYEGDTIQFPFSITDSNYISTNPPIMTKVKLSVSGIQFGSFVSGNPSTFSQTNGCLNPPCATLTPAPNDTLISVGSLTTNFYWETNCNHAWSSHVCSDDNVYLFHFNISDNYCPFPATNTYTLKVKVLPKPKVVSPKISCVKVLNNGEVEIKWNKIQDTLSSFKNFNLYLWDSNNSTLADSVYDISDYQDTIQNVNANTSSKSIFINTVSSCYFETPAYDTVSTMFLEATENINGTIELNWNPIRNDNQQHIYKIYKEYPVGNWTLYNTTVNTSFTDNAIHIGEIVNYYIETEDSVITNTGSFSCNSMSNKTSIIATSIKDSELENQITIYPNPADDIITIEYGKLRINKLEVYNSNSKLVFQKSELTSKSYKLNPDNLASGTYFIKFYIEDKIVYKKLIIK